MTNHHGWAKHRRVLQAQALEIGRDLVEFRFPESLTLPRARCENLDIADSG
jgi:hypothetical protein